MEELKSRLHVVALFICTIVLGLHKNQIYTDRDLGHFTGHVHTVVSKELICLPNLAYLNFCRDDRI